MKSLLFVVSLLSFIMYTSFKADAPIKGTWDGSYSNIEKMMDLKIVFGPGNEVQLYSNAIENKGKAMGTYAVKRNEIAITCIWPGRDSTLITMKGKLNPNQNFVAGNWESDNNTDGNFYLAKVLSK
ncbi:MAG: hypothetical protein WBC06_06340 [Chitinophagaceae bacterium]